MYLRISYTRVTYIRMYARMSLRTYLYIPVHIYVHIYPVISSPPSIRKCTCTGIYTNACMHVYIDLYQYIDVCMYTCIHIVFHIDL